MIDARNRAIEARNKAVEVVATDKQVAYRLVVSAVEYDPSFADGWAFLGDCLSDLGSIEAACSAYRTALALPDGELAGDMNPVLRQRCLMQLGHRLLDNRVITFDRIAEARRFTDRAIAMGGPATAFALTNRSLIASHEYDQTTELRCSREGFELAAGKAECELGLAFAELFNGHYADGLKHFEARFETSLPAYRNLPWRRWDGGKCGSLLVLFDMGLGDTLSFARFVPAAASRAEKVVFQVQAELLRLLTDMMAPWKNIEVRPQEHVLADVECWCPVFSLPVALGYPDQLIRVASGVPLQVKPVENTSWKARDARLHVAISWAGMAGNGIDPHRSIQFEKFLRLREVPGIKLYSVQVGERAHELHDAGGTGLVRDMSAWIRDARDTAGILAEMDCVVACESFVAHLAGAMGKRCYTLVSRLGRDWRSSPYMDNRALWYPNTMVVRQGDDCSWGPVFDRVVDLLGGSTCQR